MLYEGMLEEKDERYRAIQHKTLGRLIEQIVSPKLKTVLKARMIDQAARRCRPVQRITIICTRRFVLRPSRVLLSARGADSP